MKCDCCVKRKGGASRRGLVLLRSSPPAVHAFAFIHVDARRFYGNTRQVRAVIRFCVLYAAVYWHGQRVHVTLIEFVLNEGAISVQACSLIVLGTFSFSVLQRLTGLTHSRGCNFHW